MSKPLVGVSKAKHMAESLAYKYKEPYINNPDQPRCNSCGNFVSLGRPTSFQTQRYICTNCGHAGLKAI